jgi:NAD(P)-dependent dehydrogenase (short-subunit alcohol dehydrogenase family)
MNVILHSPATPVLVTGAASGIGRASAEGLLALGRPVALWDRNEAQVMAVAAELSACYGAPAIGYAVDLTDAAAIAPALARTRENFETLGGLVHAAGVVDRPQGREVTADNWDAVLDVNLRAMALLAEALRLDLAAQAGSAIVGIASINATLGNGLIPAYSASKGGLLSLVRSLADRYAGDGIRVNAVSPGQIRTPMIADTVAAHPGLFERRILQGRLGEPEEVARLVRFLMSDEASYVTAAEFVVDGGNISSQR